MALQTSPHTHTDTDTPTDRQPPKNASGESWGQRGHHANTLVSREESHESDVGGSDSYDV